MPENPEFSTPEQAVAEWLTKRGIHFIPQQNIMGGTTEAGGARVDFVLPESRIIIRVQSYFHTIPEAIARDTLQRIALTGMGYIVVDVWEDDIIENIERVMSAAVEGVELARERA